VAVVVGEEQEPRAMKTEVLALETLASILEAAQELQIKATTVEMEVLVCQIMALEAEAVLVKQAQTGLAQLAVTEEMGSHRRLQAHQ
jgi:hypothetical protein